MRGRRRRLRNDDNCGYGYDGYGERPSRGGLMGTGLRTPRYAVFPSSPSLRR